VVAYFDSSSVFHLTTDLAVADGGTGVSILAQNGVLYGNAANAIQALAVNATATRKYLSQISSSAPTWEEFALVDESVTYAKMQHVSATDKLLGRITVGAGDIEELTGANVRTICALATTDEVRIAKLGINQDPSASFVLAVNGETYSTGFDAYGQVGNYSTNVGGNTWVDTGYRFAYNGRKFAIVIYVQSDSDTVGHYAAGNVLAMRI
jgi:hypothetical protein